MPDRFEPSDRRVLIISGLGLSLLMAIGLLAGPGTPDHGPGFATSYSSARQGGEAAYVLLSELGYRVEHWDLAPEQLPAGPGVVLVLADPFMPASAAERSAVLAFVNGGGRVVVTGEAGAELVGDAKLKLGSFATGAWPLFNAELPSPVTRGAPQISLRPAVRSLAARTDQESLYGDNAGATVVGNRLGKGVVVWWASADPLTNQGIVRASNLALFLNSIGPLSPAPGGPSAARAGVSGAARRRPPTRVLWDEYFHGDRPGFWAYAGKTPTPWMLLQLGLVFAAALWTYGRRIGPLRPRRQPSRLTPLEFVDTMGSLYERKGAASGILEVAYRRFRTLLGRRLSLPSTANAEDLYRGTRERLGWTVPGLWETLQNCERGVSDQRLTGDQSLRLIQELYDYARRFGLET